MKESIIQISTINPVELFGVNEEKLNILRERFPKLKIISRGSSVKIIGDDANIIEFEKKLNLMMAHYHKYNRLTESNIDNLLADDGEKVLKGKDSDEIILFGNKGQAIKARTKNQRKIVEASLSNDLIFSIGPAGTGKTYLAVALAPLLKNLMTHYENSRCGYNQTFATRTKPPVGRLMNEQYRLN